MLVSEAEGAAAEVNQDSGQELSIARQGLSRNAKAQQSFMRRFDVNNDGVIDEDEAHAAAISSVELRSSLSYHAPPRPRASARASSGAWFGRPRARVELTERRSWSRCPMRLRRRRQVNEIILK